MKKIFQFPGLSKILAFQVLCIFVVMFAVNFSLVGWYKYNASEAKKANTFDQLQIIKAAIIQPFWNVDRKSLNQIIDSILIQRSGTIAAIRILDADSVPEKPIYLVDRHSVHWNDFSFEDMQGNDSFITWDSELTYKNTQLGTIQIAFSIKESQREIAHVSLLLATALLFFTALCILLFLTFHLRRLSNELQHQVEERTQQLDIQRMAMVNSSRLASLGEMSAGIAHEINNPLAVIDGTVRLLSRTILTNPDSEKLEGYLKKIANMVVRIKKIIDGLRAFSRDGSQETISQFPINKFFDDIADLCQANLTHRRIDIKFNIEDPAIILSAREVQLSQVLINMINNSGDAVESLQEKWIRVDCLTQGEDLVISITDSGQGIPEEIQKKMLLPFFTTKELGKGTGLGLSISIGIIEAHGGKLIYCKNHRNTRFEIRLKKSYSTILPFAA
ncbi:MAG: GHKL domain-containing protein [Bdellovibrionaceae bacterium]|nr:GHKL domain-containing protein [Pseudobdellovibrionaceae bacterium]